MALSENSLKYVEFLQDNSGMTAYGVAQGMGLQQNQSRRALDALSDIGIVTENVDEHGVKHYTLIAAAREENLREFATAIGLIVDDIQEFNLLSPLGIYAILQLALGQIEIVEVGNGEDSKDDV